MPGLYDEPLIYGDYSAAPSTDAALTPTEKKSLRLEQRRIDKEGRLNPEYANTLSGAQLQQILSDAVDQQVYTDVDGTKFQRDPGTGEKIPYTARNRFGDYDTRNAYIDDTPEGNLKLGLARTDQGGYEGRYAPKGTVFATGDVKQYEGTPGARGVTPQDDALMDLELPSNVATGLEYVTHTNKGQILNRAGGVTTGEIEGSRPGFGSGVSEYTTPDAPMWNMATPVEDVPLPADTYMPKEPTLYEPATTGLQPGDPGYWDDVDEDSYAGNLVSGLASGTITTVAGIADAATELGAYIVKGVVDTVGADTWYTEEDAKMAGDFFDIYAEGKWADKVTGYDSTYSDEQIDKSFDEFSDGNIFTGIVEGAKAGPDVLMKSLPYMLMMSFGGGSAVAIKAARAAKASGKALKVAEKVGKSSETIRKLTTANVKAVKAAEIARAGAKNPLISGGMAALIASEVSDSREAFIENNNGQEPDAINMARFVVVDTAKLLLEKIPFERAVKGQSAILEGVKKLIDKAPKSTKAGIAKEIGVITGTLALNVAEESVQEGLQAVADYYNREYGTAKDKGFNWEETAKAMIAGGAAGGVTGIPGKTATIAGVTKDTIIESAATARDIAVKGADIAGKGVEAVKEVTGDLVGARGTPQEDAVKEVKKRNAREEGESLSTPDEGKIEEAPIEIKETTPEVVKAEIDAVDATPSVSTIETGHSEEVAAGLAEFDKGFDGLIAKFKTASDNVVEAKGVLEEAGLDLKPEDEQAAINQTKANAVVSIENLTKYRDMIVEQSTKDGKEIPKTIQAMDDQIELLRPLTAAKTTEEVASVINDETIQTPAKVRSVLGSAAATEEQLQQVLDEIPDKESSDAKFIEAKIKVLQTFTTMQEVTTQKLLGGGSHASVFEWVSLIQKDGALNEQALANVNTFISGQRRKLGAWLDAKDEYESVGHDGSDVIVQDNPGRKKNAYRGPESDALVQRIKDEGKAMEDLADLVAEIVGKPKADTTPVVEQKSVKKAETKPEQVSRPKEVKEAPKAAEVKKPKEDIKVTEVEAIKEELPVAEEAWIPDEGIEEAPVNPDITKSDAGTVMLNVPKIRTKKREGFTDKDENHITIIGFKTAKFIKEAPAEVQSKVEALINSFEAKYILEKDAYTVSKFYPETQWTDKEGIEHVNPEVTREAVVQVADMPGLAAFYKELNTLLGTDIATPFPHVTRKVKGHKAGIAINSKEEFDKLEKVSLTKPAKIEPIKKEPIKEIPKALEPEPILEEVIEEDGYMSFEFDEGGIEYDAEAIFTEDNDILSEVKEEQALSNEQRRNDLRNATRNSMIKLSEVFGGQKSAIDSYIKTCI